MSEAPITAKKPKDDNDPDVFMMKAKESLTKHREEVLARRSAIDEELAVIDGKLERIGNYFNPQKPTAAKATRASSAGGSQGVRRAGVREHVLAAIKKSPDGIKRQDLLKAMDAIEKSHEQSIANAVAALTREGKITNPSKGHYRAA